MRITPHANCRDYIWGGCRLENGGNPPQTNLKQVLNHLSGFENFTFFDFQKKFFSLHPIIYIDSALLFSLWVFNQYNMANRVSKKQTQKHKNLNEGQHQTTVLK